MSTAIDPESMNWMRRVRYTPMRDVLRGRWTGRLNVRARIDRAATPDNAKQLVARVVKRTRLWPLEKIDVADELIAHFADGLESGASIDDLIKSFGDEKRAAAMIRRAKRRNRPMAWHVLRTVGLATALLVTVYIGLAIYFFNGRPNISVRYLDQLNAATAALPEDQRAWPLYQQAMRGLAPIFFAPTNGNESIYQAAPDRARWPEFRAWVNDHATDVELIRQGAARPVAGFKLTMKSFQTDPESFLFPYGPPVAAREPTDPNPPLYNAASTTSGDLDYLNTILAIDAQVALEAREGDRFARDVEAMSGVAHQITRGGFRYQIIPTSDLQMMELALDRAPDVLDNAVLARLAHGFSKPTVAADFGSFAAYRIMFLDMVQRTYTDDGAGDGRLSMPAAASLSSVEPVTWASVKRNALSPITYLAVPSRRTATIEFDRIVDLAEALLRQPIRNADWASVRRDAKAFNARLPVDAFEFAFDFEPLAWSAERYLGRRDGIVTAIALELYRRDHGGAYPASLDALVPRYLPAVPLDRIDGQPIRYHLINGKPRIYSVGVDRKDDGGRSAKKMDGESVAERAARWPINKNPSYAPPDGDWILFPQSSDILDAPTK